jgi:hypothetical protein
MTEEVILKWTLIDLYLQHLQETLRSIEGKDWQKDFGHMQFGFQEFVRLPIAVYQSIDWSLVLKHYLVFKEGE